MTLSVFSLAQAEPTSIGLWSLFAQSFDLFTVVLIAGSMVAVALIAKAVIEVRPSAILPEETAERAVELAKSGDEGGLRRLFEGERSFLAPVVIAALDARPEARKEAAELAAGEQVALWFRKVEMLSVIGNIAPLVGLAGTVWGMIIAFTTLGDAGGEAGPAALSLGISKALFHTLLGLCLAIPCLSVYGVYKSVLDRHLTRAMGVASDVVDRLGG